MDIHKGRWEYSSLQRNPKNVHFLGKCIRNEFKRVLVKDSR